MNHGISDWAVMAGVIIGIIAVIIGLVLGKNQMGSCVFDERQERARGKAYKYGFITLVIYLCIYSFIDDMAEPALESGLSVGAIGICIGVAVFAVVSIWNDAYFSIQQEPKRYAIIFAGLFLMNFLLGISNLHASDGEANYALANIAVSILAAVVLAAIGVKSLKNRRETDEEES